MDNTLRLSFHSDPATIDPQECGDKLSSALIFLLYKGLTRLEADGSIRCDLADRYQIFNNHKKYVFSLGDHVWSDGTPITAHDFVYSWKRALAPDFLLKATNFFFRLKNAKKAKEGRVSLNKVGVFAKDDRTLEVHLENSCTSFLELVSFCVFFPVPSHIKEKQNVRVLSGPFILESWTQGKEIFLRRNMRCKSIVPVSLDGIYIKIVSNAKQAFTLFQDNQLDWLGSPISPIPTNFLPALISSKQIKPLSGMTSLWFNTTVSPFSNSNLRKAFAYAIPREELLERLFLPNALVAKSFNPVPSPFDDRAVLFNKPKEKARLFFDRAMEEIKMKHFSIALTFEDTDEFSRVAVLIKSYFEQLFPIHVQLEPLRFKEFWQYIPHYQFQVCLRSYLSQTSDSVQFLEKLEHKASPINFSGWENSEYQDLIKRIRNTTDPKKQNALIKKAESILIEAMPIAPIYHYHFAYLQNERVKNLGISSVGSVRFDRVYLDECSQASMRKVYNNV